MRLWLAAAAMASATVFVVYGLVDDFSGEALWQSALTGSLMATVWLLHQRRRTLR